MIFFSSYKKVVYSIDWEKLEGEVLALVDAGSLYH